ncbi:MAG: sensor histidine kinase, partial [Acidimicrobiales bacterium]
MPIRVRLALLFAAGAALLVAAGGIVFTIELSAGLHSSLLSSLQTQAAAVAQSLPDAGAPAGPGSGEAGSAGSAGAADSASPSGRQVGSGAGKVAGGGAGGTNAGPGGAGDNDEPLSQVLSRSGRVLEATGGPAASTPLLDPAQRAAAQEAPVTFQRTVPPDASPFLVLATPAGGARAGAVVVVAASLDLANQSVHRVVVALAVGGPLAVLLAGLGAWVLAGAALAPVERMRRQAAEISERDRDASLVVPGTRDEVASLALTLNQLLDRLQGALSRQRGFVAAAGHELRTPLAILRAELELASRRGRSRDELAAAVASAGEETERLVRLAEDLLLLARSDEAAPMVRPVPQDLVSVVSRSAEAFGDRAGGAGVELVLRSPDSVVVPLDEARMRQVVDNLLDNALRFAPRGSAVDLTVRTGGPAGGPEGRPAAVVEVGDRGPGFPDDFLPHAFERFRRPDQDRGRDHGGAGLGLSIVQALVEAHGGRVTVTN